MSTVVKVFCSAVFMKSYLIVLLLFQLPSIYCVTFPKFELVLSLRRFFHSEIVYLFHNGDFGIKSIDTLVQQQTVLSKEMCLTSVITSFNNLKQISDQSDSPFFVLPQNDSMAAHSILSNVVSRDYSNARWLLFLDKNSKIEEFFNNIYIPFDCEFLVAQPEEDHVTLTEVYRVSPTLPLQTYRFGNWTADGGLSRTLVEFYERRQNLNGLVLKTAVVNNYTTKVVKGKDGKPTVVTGDFVEMFKLIAQDLNFTLDLYTPPDDYFGTPNNNGTWNGITGMLQRGEVDFSCTYFLMTPARLNVVDFLTPIYHVKTKLVIRDEQTHNNKLTEFFRPFSAKLWMLQVSIMLLIAVCFLVTYKIGRRHGHEDSLESSIYNLGDALFYTHASFCQQSHDCKPKTISCRLVLLTSYLTAVVLMAGYSASLISYLTTKESKFPFTNFKEFLEDGTYHLGMLPQSAFPWYFESTTDPVMNKIYKKMIEPNMAKLPKTDKEGFDRACDIPKYAWLTFTSVGFYPTTCNLLEIKEIHIPGSLSMIISKRSPYKGVFNYKIQKMNRGGILKRIGMKFKPMREFVPKKRNPVVYLVQLIPLFALLGTSLIISILLLLLEKKKASTKQQRWLLRHEYY